MPISHPRAVFVSGTALVAQLPDGTAAGGNARGANAVDLQQSRTVATQVASGINATIGGGANNTSSGVSATIAGGSTNSATASSSVVSGGFTNLASGLRSWIPGGGFGSTRGISGIGAWSAGNFLTAGDAQSEEHPLRRQTTDATATRLTSDGAVAFLTNTVNLANNSLILVTLLVVARQTGGAAGSANDSAAWEIKVAVKRGASAAATAIVGNPSITRIAFDAAAAAWAVALAADTTNGGLALTVTGEANKNINWAARGMAVQVG